MEIESDFQIKEERIDLEDLIIPSKVEFVKQWVARSPKQFVYKIFPTISKFQIFDPSASFGQSQWPAEI